MRRMMKSKNNKVDYERRWEEFFKAESRDRKFEEIPWPKKMKEKKSEGEERRKMVEEMIEIATFTVREEDKERERKLEIKKWHPDKVMQKINVKEADAEFVALVVKELAQALNSLKPN